MSIKQVVTMQYQKIVEQATVAATNLPQPTESWVRTVRKALQMSGAQLARKLGVTRALVSQAEKAEISGRITIRKMRELAEAMDCRFVYAIVPKTSVQEIITGQTRAKAEMYVAATSKHMAMEAQVLSPDQIEYEVQRIARQLSDARPRDFWDHE